MRPPRELAYRVNRIMTMEDRVRHFAGGVQTGSSFHLWTDTGHAHGGVYLNWGRFGYDNGRSGGAEVLIGCASLPAALALLYAKTGVKLILT